MNVTSLTQTQQIPTDTTDYSLCLRHGRDFVYIDKETMQFYCIDCVADVSISLKREKLSKTTREANAIKEKAKEATSNISKLKSKIEGNIKNIGIRIINNQNAQKEV